jgi:hypothetical protein
MMEGPVGGVLAIFIATAIVAVVVGAAAYASEIVGATVRVGRYLRMIPPAPPTPVGMPLERIAADLRRLRAEASRHQPGMPMAKYRGLMAAYDDALLDACRALELDTDLSTLADGVERESERLRVEYELERAGIRFREE